MSLFLFVYSFILDGRCVGMTMRYSLAPTQFIYKAWFALRYFEGQCTHHLIWQVWGPNLK